ncbi:unnamed protein product [Fusarium graminearum]|nr:unnamed protein product [Fusarium graminearum]
MPAPERADVIDLTQEPDSPIQLPTRSIPQPAQILGNPRRTNSQHVSQPQLVPTDSGPVGRRRIVIDLTADPPEEGRFSSRYPHDGLVIATPIEHERISPPPARDLIYGSEYRSFRRFAEVLGLNIAGLNPPSPDISRNAFARPPSPKPRMPTPPPTREGFTRNTCLDPEKESESVVICPSCNEELAYDPLRTVTQGKRKRGPEEHHFWALKKCGHVYCVDCYKNRNSTEPNRDRVGFRSPDARMPYPTANDLLCAVDNCSTNVFARMEWVGIFL